MQRQGFEAEFSGFDLGKIENIVDHPEQMPCRHVNAVEPLGLASRYPFAAHHAGHADDRVHRGTDFVAHVGEENAFRTAGAFCLLPRRFGLGGPLGDALLQRFVQLPQLELDLFQLRNIGLMGNPHLAQLRVLKGTDIDRAPETAAVQAPVEDFTAPPAVAAQTGNNMAAAALRRTGQGGNDRERRLLVGCVAEHFLEAPVAIQQLAIGGAHQANRLGRLRGDFALQAQTRFGMLASADVAHEDVEQAAFAGAVHDADFDIPDATVLAPMAGFEQVAAAGQHPLDMRAHPQPHPRATPDRPAMCPTIRQRHSPKPRRRRY